MEKLDKMLKNEYSFQSDEEVVKQMMDEYKKCPNAIKYINSLGVPSEVVENNISLIFDLVMDLNYCKKCPGVLKCDKENPRMVSKIVYQNGFLDRQIVPCKQLIKQIEFERQFIYRDFEDHILYKSLKDIEARNVQGRKELLARYSLFTKEHDTSWIYLTGAEGTGRSFLASLISVDIARRNGGPIAYINAMTRLKELANLSFKDEKEFQRRMAILTGIPVLVIDDFGNEYKTEVVRDVVLFPILQKRSNRRLLTIFTSDFTLPEITEMYSLNSAGRIRANQLSRLIKGNIKEEINLGEVSIY